MRIAMKAIAAVAAAAITAISATPCTAQQAPSRFASSQDTVRLERRAWSPIRVAKWTTALASSGAVTYGFILNRDADRDYEQIELLCKNNEAACIKKPASDEYADPALEARYDAIVRRDDRAQLALLAGQIGLAASVLLFIVDLPQGTTTNDIPYDPSPLRLGMRAEQVELGISVSVR
jgi:hypothetical protein